MTLSDEAIQYGRDVVRKLVEEQCRIPVRPTTSIGLYYRQAKPLIDEADFYYTTQQFEQSFILYSRYITLFVEELKLRHPDYATVSTDERERIKQIIRAKALPRAEELKAKLREKYAREYGMKQNMIQDEENDKISTAIVAKLTINIPNENEQVGQQPYTNYPQYPPSHVAFFATPPVNHGPAQRTIEPTRPIFDRTQKPISSSIYPGMGSFRRVIVPNDITPKFLQVARRNTERAIETCGILAGIRKDAYYVITHIVVPKQNGGPDSCDTEKEEEMVEYMATYDLITLGWIHTHPTQTTFCSSVDLHTHLCYQMLLQEAIAIVISPKYNNTEIYSITPDVGIATLSSCTKKGFHQHTSNPPLYIKSPHTSYDSSLQCQIVDLRN